MRIGSPSSQSVQNNQAELAKLSHRAKVLKKALENQKDTSSELLKLLDPKGKVIDIRA